MRDLPEWEDARHTPEARVNYHNAHFKDTLRILAKVVEDMRVNGLKGEAMAFELGLDALDQCFIQQHCDVVQGFPGYGPATWSRKSEKPSLVKAFMDQNRKELIKIRDNTAEYDWLEYINNLLENEPYTDKDIFGVLGSLLLTYDNLPDDCVDEKTMIDYMIIELDHHIVELYDI
jgi:hypothetical protein